MVLPEFPIGDLDLLEMFFRLQPFGFVILEFIGVPELGLGPEGLADGGLRDLLVGEAEGAGVLEAAFTGTGHSLPSLGQCGQGGSCFFKQEPSFGFLLLEAFDHLRGGFG